jgi:hypothetical protein
MLPSMLKINEMTFSKHLQKRSYSCVLVTLEISAFASVYRLNQHQTVWAYDTVVLQSAEVLLTMLIRQE